LKPIFDFSFELSKIIDDKAASSMAVTKCHQIKVDKLGIFTKEFDDDQWSEWRGRSPSQGSGIEPIQLIKKEATAYHVNPPYIKFENFSDPRMQKMAASFTSMNVLTDTIKQYCEWDGELNCCHCKCQCCFRQSGNNKYNRTL
jgi:hypothetical protein